MRVSDSFAPAPSEQIKQAWNGEPKSCPLPELRHICLCLVALFSSYSHIARSKDQPSDSTYKPEVLTTIILWERKISPKFSCIKSFQIRDVLTQILGNPSHSLSKTTKRPLASSLCPGYPDIWAPDVPGKSCPKTLSLGCFSVLILCAQTSPKGRSKCVLDSPLWRTPAENPSESLLFTVRPTARHLLRSFLRTLLRSIFQNRLRTPLRRVGCPMIPYTYTQEIGSDHRTCQRHPANQPTEDKGSRISILVPRRDGSCEVEGQTRRQRPAETRERQSTERTRTRGLEHTWAWPWALRLAVKRSSSTPASRALHLQKSLCPTRPTHTLIQDWLRAKCKSGKQIMFVPSCVMEMRSAHTRTNTCTFTSMKQHWMMILLCIYIYTVKLLSGPSLAISGVIIWAK